MDITLRFFIKQSKSSESIEESNEEEKRGLTAGNVHSNTSIKQNVRFIPPTIPSQSSTNFQTSTTQPTPHSKAATTAQTKTPTSNTQGFSFKGHNLSKINPPDVPDIPELTSPQAAMQVTSTPGPQSQTQPAFSFSNFKSASVEKKTEVKPVASQPVESGKGSNVVQSISKNSLSTLQKSQTFDSSSILVTSTTQSMDSPAADNSVDVTKSSSSVSPHPLIQLKRDVRVDRDKENANANKSVKTPSSHILKVTSVPTWQKKRELQALCQNLAMHEEFLDDLGVLLHRMNYDPQLFHVDVLPNNVIQITSDYSESYKIQDRIETFLKNYLEREIVSRPIEFEVRELPSQRKSDFLDRFVRNLNLNSKIHYTIEENGRLFGYSINTKYDDIFNKIITFRGKMSEFCYKTFQVSDFSNILNEFITSHNEKMKDPSDQIQFKKEKDRVYSITGKSLYIKYLHTWLSFLEEYLQKLPNVSEVMKLKETSVELGRELQRFHWYYDYENDDAYYFSRDALDLNQIPVIRRPVNFFIKLHLIKHDFMLPILESKLLKPIFIEKLHVKNEDLIKVKDEYRLCFVVDEPQNYPLTENELVNRINTLLDGCFEYSKIKHELIVDKVLSDQDKQEFYPLLITALGDIVTGYFKFDNGIIHAYGQKGVLIDTIYKRVTKSMRIEKKQVLDLSAGWKKFLTVFCEKGNKITAHATNKYLTNVVAGRMDQAFFVAYNKLLCKRIHEKSLKIKDWNRVPNINYAEYETIWEKKKSYLVLYSLNLDRLNSLVDQIIITAYDDSTGIFFYANKKTLDYAFFSQDCKPTWKFGVVKLRSNEYDVFVEDDDVVIRVSTAANLDYLIKTLQNIIVTREHAICNTRILEDFKKSYKNENVILKETVKGLQFYGYNVDVNNAYLTYISFLHDKYPDAEAFEVNSYYCKIQTTPCLDVLNEFKNLKNIIKERLEERHAVEVSFPNSGLIKLLTKKGYKKAIVTTLSSIIGDEVLKTEFTDKKTFKLSDSDNKTLHGLYNYEVMNYIVTNNLEMKVIDINDDFELKIRGLRDQVLKYKDTGTIRFQVGQMCQFLKTSPEVGSAASRYRQVSNEHSLALDEAGGYFQLRGPLLDALFFYSYMRLLESKAKK